MAELHGVRIFRQFVCSVAELEVIDITTEAGESTDFLCGHHGPHILSHLLLVKSVAITVSQHDEVALVVANRKLEIYPLVIRHEKERRLVLTVALLVEEMHACHVSRVVVDHE